MINIHKAFKTFRTKRDYTSKDTQAHERNLPTKHIIEAYLKPTHAILASNPICN